MASQAKTHCLRSNKPEDSTTDQQTNSLDLETIITRCVDKAIAGLKSDLTLELRAIIAPIITAEVAPLKEELSNLKAEFEALKVAHKKPVNNVTPLMPTNPESSHKLSELTFTCDTLEQYTRRNSIRIYNVPLVEGEDTTDITIAVCNAMDVPLIRRDIDVSHRVKGGTPKSAPDSIIVKFVRREVKAEVMKKKRLLKDSNNYKRVFIEEDLTIMRRKIIQILKETGEQHSERRVWSRDGKIRAKELVKDQHGHFTQQYRDVSINNYVDFLKLNFNTNKCNYIGLPCLF